MRGACIQVKTKHMRVRYAASPATYLPHAAYRQMYDILGPMPGSSIISSTVGGMSPSYFSCSISAVRFMYLTAKEETVVMYKGKGPVSSVGLPSLSVVESDFGNELIDLRL